MNKDSAIFYTFLLNHHAQISLQWEYNSIAEAIFVLRYFILVEKIYKTKNEFIICNWPQYVSVKIGMNDNTQK